MRGGPLLTGQAHLADATIASPREAGRSQRLVQEPSITNVSPGFL